MKKYSGYLLIAVFIALTLSSCGRDLSTPSSRLVGHWKADSYIQAEYYFSKIDSKTGIGKQTEYDPRDGTVFICDYKISSETPDGEKLRIFVSCPGYEEFDDFTDFVIQKDGMTATMRKFTINYIDSKTEYEQQAEEDS